MFKKKQAAADPNHVPEKREEIRPPTDPVIGNRRFHKSITISVRRQSPILCQAEVAGNGPRLWPLQILGSLNRGNEEVFLKDAEGKTLMSAVVEGGGSRAVQVRDWETGCTYTVCGSSRGRSGWKPAIWIWRGSDWSGVPIWAIALDKNEKSATMQDLRTSKVVAKITNPWLIGGRTTSGRMRTKVKVTQGADNRLTILLAACMDEICDVVFERSMPEVLLAWMDIKSGANRVNHKR